MNSSVGRVKSRKFFTRGVIFVNSSAERVTILKSICWESYSGEVPCWESCNLEVLC